jgi:hypothetical protein
MDRPKYEVEFDDGSILTVEASYADEAAEEAVDMYEYGGSSFPVANGKKDEFVTVRLDGQAVGRYKVTGECVPHYYAEVTG